MVGRVVERPFTLPRPDRASLSAVVWEPDGVAAPGLVLLGHGGGTDKRGDRNQRLAHRLTGEHGLRVAAIDGPFHGDRPPPPGVGYQEATAAEGPAAVMARMVTDWTDALAALDAVRRVERLGYLGLSMGARHGLGLAAALGDRLACAVLGKYGLDPSPVLHPGLDDRGLTLRLAGGVRCPVLFHLTEEDEIFPAAGQRALVEALGTTAVTLKSRPRRHGSTTPEDEDAWVAFLVHHLTHPG